MKAQRSNTATRLRRHCAALFGVSEADMLLPDKRREKFRGRIGWVDAGQGIGSYSSVDVEILHNDFTGHYNLQTAFLNPILMWVSCIVFHLLNVSRNSPADNLSGFCCNYPGSNHSQGIDERYTVKSKNGHHGSKAWNSTYYPWSYSRYSSTGMCYELDHVWENHTYELSQSRWALSADDCLQGVGANTGINYGRDFEEYLEILMTGLQKKKKSILNVFRQWDHVIFPNSDSSLVGNADKDTSRGLKAALMMLEDDEEEEEEDETIYSGDQFLNTE